MSNAMFKKIHGREMTEEDRQWLETMEHNDKVMLENGITRVEAMIPFVNERLGEPVRNSINGRLCWNSILDRQWSLSIGIGGNAPDMLLVHNGNPRDSLLEVIGKAVIAKFIVDTITWDEI